MDDIGLRYFFFNSQVQDCCELVQGHLQAMSEDEEEVIIHKTVRYKLRGKGYAKTARVCDPKITSGASGTYRWNGVTCQKCLSRKPKGEYMRDEVQGEWHKYSETYLEELLEASRHVMKLINDPHVQVVISQGSMKLLEAHAHMIASDMIPD